MLLNIAAYIFVFKIEQNKIRKEMKSFIRSRLSDEELDLIIITNANRREFQSIHSKEFRYKGSLYDIVREMKTKDTTFYWAVKDDKENDLIVKFSKYIDDKPVSNMKLNADTGKNFFKVFHFDTVFINYKFDVIERASNSNYDFEFEDFNSIILEIESPPPRI